MATDSSQTAASKSPDSKGADLSGALVLLMAIACGTTVASLYYAQTLIDVIGPDIGLSTGMAGVIVTLTQLGYGVGLALIVPLSDLFENKRLVLIATAISVAGSLGIATSTGPATFLIASLVTGICTVGAQILVPLAAHLSSHERQGRTIGLVMSGLLTGIMLARPVASFVAEHAGWRAVFLLSAAVTTAISVALAVKLPTRRPETRMHYGAILHSTLTLLRDHPALRLRAFYQAMMFVAFNLFWTAAPLVLIRQFHFGQDGVALFALAGAGGALAAPIAGALADRGKARRTTVAAMLLISVSFLAAGWAVAAGSLVAFVITAVLIDSAVQLNQISGQKIIFALSAEARGRINAAYMSIVFLIGASGSLIGSASYAAGGWRLSAAIGAGIGLLALATFATFDRKKPA
jgi:predicted MFS family arabinose efflux permease